MATIAEGWVGTNGGILLADERRKLDTALQVLKEAYYQGPFLLPPDQLIAQLKEQGPDLLYDLVQQLQWETLGTFGYAQNLTAERTRAIDESRRLWKYNPLAQWMIWLHTNYGFGENIIITPEDKDAAKVWNEFWTADRNQAVLAADRIADKLSNGLLVDGDRFLVFYISTVDGEVYIRHLNTKEIVEIVTDPDDSNVPLFYKRQWATAKGEQRTWYYPDWEAFFREDLDRAKLPQGAPRADKQKSKTAVCVLHIAFNGKDEDSLFGWPFLGTGSPWIRAQKRFMEDRLAVSAAKAMYVRKAKVSGGSRAVDNVIANLRSGLSAISSVETNPPATAASTLTENQAVDTTDFPMTTGAADAKTDGEMFAWMAGLSGGIFPHYMGMGDAYRLATATSMEAPLQRQFSRYQLFFSAQFRRMVRIVLQAKEKYGGAKYKNYDAEVSTDQLVEVDLDGMSQALGRVFETIVNPMTELDRLPAPVVEGMLRAALTTVLQALGADAEAVVGDEIWPETEPEAEEGELEEAVVMALQNWRDGEIDADDLVAFLAPMKLEEGGPGWSAPPDEDIEPKLMTPVVEAVKAPEPLTVEMPHIEINMPEQVPPQITMEGPQIVVNVPEQVPPQITMEGPQIVVNVPEQPAPQVTVERPQIDVHMPEQAAPQVVMEAPELSLPEVHVHVDAELHSPDEVIETETMIERDEDQLIRRTTKRSKKRPKND